MADGLLEQPENISQTANDVAQATGVAYQDLAAEAQEPVNFAEYNAEGVGQQLETEAPVQSGLDFIDEDKSTVRGQMNSLLSDNSTYMQEARRTGEEEQARKGLLSSSAAIGASQRAAIKSALPIAQQDAQTYAAAQGREQDQANRQTQVQTEAIVSGGLSQQNASIRQSQQNAQNHFTALMEGTKGQQNVWLQDMNNQHTAHVQELDRQHQLLLQREDISAKEAAALDDKVAVVMRDYNINVENMLTDPDFLSLDAEAVQNGLDQMRNISATSIEMLGQMAEVDLSGFVADYVASNTTTFTPTGFDPNETV